MKLYTLISLGLIFSLYATSCSEDKIVNTNPGVADPELTDITVKGKISNESGFPVSWAAGDGFTLWNKMLGRSSEFNISEAYDGSNPSSEADFTGQATFANDPSILALFPKKEAKVFNDLLTLSFADTCKLSEYRKNLLMTATGKVTDGTLPELTFNKISSSLKFVLSNTSNQDLNIAYVTLQGLTDVFPKSVKLGENGEVGELYDANKVVSVDMEGAVLPLGGTLDACTYILPTTNGTQSLLKGNTPLTALVTLQKGDQLMEYEAWTGTVSELPLRGNININEYSYQLCSGIEYVLELKVNDFVIPDGGYAVDSYGNLTIYNSEGLKYLRDNASQFINSTITVDPRFLSNNKITIDQWLSIPEFNGTFEGNGVVLDGVKEFVEINNGVIKNVTLSNASLSNENASSNADDNNNGLLAKVNRGQILNCCVTGSSVTVSGENGNTGAIVGFNDAKGIIFNSNVLATDFVINTTKQRVGAIAGLNWGKIINCSVMNDVNIQFKGTDVDDVCIGGLIGLNNGGIVTACRSFVKIDMGLSQSTRAPQVGGLIGSAWSWRGKGQIGISYAIPTITSVGDKTFGLIGVVSSSGANIFGCYSIAEGYGLVPSDAVGDVEASYYVGTPVTSSKGENVADKTVLQSKVDAMNNSVLGSGYKYVNGNELEPLVITSEDSGTEGPDLGEGGEI